AVDIQLGVAVAPARPQETVPRLENPKVIVNVHPRFWTGFGQHLARTAGVRVHKVQLHCVLYAVEDFRPEQPVAQPAEPGNVNISLFRERNPFDLTTTRAHYAETHRRVVSPALGYFSMSTLGCVGSQSVIGYVCT